MNHRKSQMVFCGCSYASNLAICPQILGHFTILTFDLGKLVGELIMPLPVILIFLSAGVVLQATSKFRRLFLCLLVGATILLWVSSIPPFTEYALKKLEGAYPILHDPPQADWIVVLGGGVRGNADWPAPTRLGVSSMYRIVEGVRLAKLLPDARLIASGGSPGKDTTAAQLMAFMAQSRGIAKDRIVIHDWPGNTVEEARAVAECLDSDATIILVTSAFHMRRAMALFQAQGLSVIAAPTGHLIKPEREGRNVCHYLPHTKYIVYAQRVLKEMIGSVYAEYAN